MTGQASITWILIAFHTRVAEIVLARTASLIAFRPCSNLLQSRISWEYLRRQVNWLGHRKILFLYSFIQCLAGIRLLLQIRLGRLFVLPWLQRFDQSLLQTFEGILLQPTYFELSNIAVYISFYFVDPFVSWLSMAWLNFLSGNEYPGLVFMDLV